MSHTQNICETSTGALEPKVPHWIDLNNPKILTFAGEYLDARRDGLLKDWTPAEYIQRRERDESNKLSGGLSAVDDDDDFEKEI